MDKHKLVRLAGKVLIGIGVVGMTFGIGNLASLPSLQRQLKQAMPTAESAIAQVVSVSRTKSYYGIGLFACLLLCGGAMNSVKRRLPKAQPAADDH